MTNIRYKLSSQDRTTHNGFLLPADGVWFEPSNLTDPPQPCSDTVLHHYADPRLAMLFNPVHADYDNPRLFEIEIKEELGSDGMKGWCRSQRIVRELPLPVISVEQRVAFAIYCAEPYGCRVWQEWARKWMAGEDRSAAAAQAAAWAGERAAALAAWAAAQAARAAQAALAAAQADFIAIIDRVGVPKP